MAERQHELTVIVPIKKGICKCDCCGGKKEKAWRDCLDDVLQQDIGYQCAHKAANRLLRDEIAELHFMSLFTFAQPGDSSKAYLVLEASFDGSARSFASNLANRFGKKLEKIFSHCCGFEPGAGLANFIWAHRRIPECVYVGGPGLERRQIQQERWFREHLRYVRDHIVARNPADYAHFVKVTKRLDEEFKDAKSRPPLDHPARLDHPAPPTPLRVIAGQPMVSVVALLIPLVLVTLYVLAFGRWPAWDRIALEPSFLAVVGAAIVVFAYVLLTAGSGLLLGVLVILGVLTSAVGAAAISQIVPDQMFIVSRFALAGIAVVVATIVLWLYVLETRENESEQLVGVKDKIDTDLMDEHKMRLVCQDENSPGCMQNHFVNLAVVKGGLLRLFSLRVALRIVHVLGVLYFNRGKLGGIPSIHFARWIVLPAGEFGKDSILLFMTNYDSSWDSYLGDFVDEASEGVSGIWSNTGGFPRTWFLVFSGGSRFEKQFKAYARKGQLRSSAWFSAYPNVSVQEKLSNAALRRGFERRNRRNAPVRAPSIRDIAKQDDLLRRL